MKARLKGFGKIGQIMKAAPLCRLRNGRTARQIFRCALTAVIVDILHHRHAGNRLEFSGKGIHIDIDGARNSRTWETPQTAF